MHGCLARQEADGREVRLTAPPSVTFSGRPSGRTPGFSLTYSLATALFGGFTPAISTYLIRATGFLMPVPRGRL